MDVGVKLLAERSALIVCKSEDEVKERAAVSARSSAALPKAQAVPLAGKSPITLLRSMFLGFDVAFFETLTSVGITRGSKPNGTGGGLGLI